jgi:hypothetical protein
VASRGNHRSSTLSVHDVFFYLENITLIVRGKKIKNRQFEDNYKTMNNIKGGVMTILDM